MDARTDTYITDFGRPLALEVDSESIRVERYGVWQRSPARGNRHQVVETGADLESLRNKYGVPMDRVIAMPIDD